jgi:hypothetical protein
MVLRKSRNEDWKLVMIYDPRNLRLQHGVEIRIRSTSYTVDHSTSPGPSDGLLVLSGLGHYHKNVTPEVRTFFISTVNLL